MLMLVNLQVRRNEFDGDYVEMLKLVEKDKNYVDVVIWKFCDFDVYL